MEIKFTKVALEETQYKLEIVADSEGGLAESYGYTNDEAADLYAKWSRRSPGTYTLDEKEAALIRGELDNAADIAYGTYAARVYKHVIQQIDCGGVVKRNWAPRTPRPVRTKDQKGRVYPVNGVIEELNECVRAVAVKLQLAYRERTRAQGRDVVKLDDRQLVIYAVKSRRGHAFYNLRGKRVITIPQHAIARGVTDPSYLDWYVGHELAHHYNQYTGLIAYRAKRAKSACDGHGPMFMHWLKQMVPVEAQHYELGYKPRNARAAGIKKMIA